MSLASRPSTPPLEVVVCELPPECLVAVAGELDLCTAPELVRTLRGLDRSDRVVTLDLRALTFMDVGGVRALADVRRFTSESGRELQVLRPLPDVTRVMELTGTLDLLD